MTTHDLLRELGCREGLDGEVAHLEQILACMFLVTTNPLAAPCESSSSAGAAGFDEHKASLWGCLKVRWWSDVFLEVQGK